MESALQLIRRDVDATVARFSKQNLMYLLRCLTITFTDFFFCREPPVITNTSSDVVGGQPSSRTATAREVFLITSTKISSRERWQDSL
jgi:hypothetical protein